MLSEKPSYLSVTTKIGFKLPTFWCALSLLIGVLVDEISGAIFVSLTSLAIAWVCFKFTCFFLSFQEHSGIVSNSTFDKVIKILWAISVLGWCIFILKATLYESGSSLYYEAVFSIVHYGFMLGVSQKWGAHFVETRV